MSSVYYRRLDTNYNFLLLRADGENIDEAQDLLYGYVQKAYPAIGSALKRADVSGKAYAAKIIRNEYCISAADFKDYTSTKKFIDNRSGVTTLNIYFRGRHIPLLKFDTKIDKDGRVITRVKRSSTKTLLKHAFYQQVGKYNHSGIFERSSNKSLPIKEKLGPSTPQIMSYNEDIEQAIGDKVRESFDKRLEHEVNAVLNGWRL